MIRSFRLCNHWLKPVTYQVTRAPVARAMSLNPGVYHDPEYYQFEQKQIWGKHWFAVEHSQSFQTHGDTKVIDVGDQSFIITCDRNLQVRAFHNVCRHRGAKLCAESGNRKRINCPYHWWSYNLKGDLIAAPFFEREEFDRSQFGLLPVRVGVHGGLVWICTDPEAPSLVDQLQGAPHEFDHYPFHELEIKGERRYDADCDWKLLAENFMEWYHVGPVHPNLAKFSTPETHQFNQGAGKYVSFVTAPLATSGAISDLCNWNQTPGHDALGRAAPSQFDPATTAYFYHLFPNVSITIYPHSVYTLVMLPQGPGKSTEKLSLLQHPSCRLSSDSDEEYKTKISKLMDFVCEVNDEDIEICERLAKGQRQSAYHGGMFEPEQEFSIYRFQNMVADQMTGTQVRYTADISDYSKMTIPVPPVHDFADVAEVPKTVSDSKDVEMPVASQYPLHVPEVSLSY